MNLIKTNIKVLVIEDNPGDQFLLKEQLCAAITCKENVQFTETLSASVELLSHFSPDIILLDLTLPDSMGIQTFEIINQYFSSTPIVILSGLEDTNLAIHAITLGAQDYLQKGNFDENLLFRTIRYSIERKKTMEDLRVSNERYMLVSKATNDMVWDWDIQKDTVYRNEEQFCRMLKLPPHLKDHGGEFWFGRIHPEDAMRLESEMMSIQSNPEKLFFEIEYRFLNGEDQYIHLFDRGYIIRDKDGKPARLIGSTQDITTQKEINSELNKLSMIARETKNGVIITDTNGNIEWVNVAFERITGYMLDEVRGKKPGDFLQGPETDPLSVAYMHAQLQKQKAFEVELLNYDREGKKYWINLQVQPIFNEQGQLQQYFSIQSDITAEKRSEEVLKQSEEQYRYLFMNNPAAISIWYLDDFTIAEANDKLVEIYGYSRYELSSMTIKQFRTEEEIPAIIDFANKARAAKDFQVTRLWKHKNRKGKEIYMQITSQKIIYRNRPAILAISIDVTEKKFLELKLEEERLQKEKEITNAVLTAQENEKEYIGRELHDNVNQILASARLFVGLSKSKTTPESLQQADDLLNKAIEEIRILSHSLIPPSFEVTQLGESLEQLINIVESTTPIRFNKQYFRTDYSGVPKLVQLTIYRTVQEQLNNIIKYANAKHVLIKTDRNDEDLFLKIEDDGIGFDTGKKSMGVGLLNIQTRAAVSNGTMHLESSPGNGCKLHLHFKL